MDIDRNGVVWVPLASGHLASFDRRKCKGPLNGPTAAKGQHVSRRLDALSLPGPAIRGIAGFGQRRGELLHLGRSVRTRSGLGKNMPIATGKPIDALLALVDGKWVIMRVPYPMGFFAKGMDGRIDDANAGWKGRGLWSTYRQPRAVPYRRRQGHDQQGRAFPDPARPAGGLSVITASVAARARRSISASPGAGMTPRMSCIC